MKKITTLSLLASCLLSLAPQLYADSCSSGWEKLLDTTTLNSASAINDSLLGLCDQPLKDKLQELAMSHHQVLKYNVATKLMYTKLDVEDGILCSVYNSKQCNLEGEEREYKLNCEHTWPKSLGAKHYPALSDLHHLYPAEKDVNNLRGNLPFCEVTSIEWQDEESKMGTAGKSIDDCFEPPNAHKGNVARSMFYFSVRYGKTISKKDEEMLRRWHQLDPVDAREIRRNNLIEEAQGNRNAFIDQPLLVDLISDF